jgi:hypothetical protein
VTTSLTVGLIIALHQVDQGRILLVGLATLIVTALGWFLDLLI